MHTYIKGRSAAEVGAGPRQSRAARRDFLCSQTKAEEQLPSPGLPTSPPDGATRLPKLAWTEGPVATAQIPAAGPRLRAGALHREHG